MTDTYTKIANSPLGRLVAPRVGLPQPVELERHVPGAPVVDGLWQPDPRRHQAAER